MASCEDIETVGKQNFAGRNLECCIDFLCMNKEFKNNF